MLIAFKKLAKLFNNKIVLYISFFILLLILSVLFYIYSPLFAFDDVHIFGNLFVRIGLIGFIWITLIIYFFLKPIIDIIQSIKNDDRQLEKTLKKEVKDILQKAKRNYTIALNDAKNTWKKDLRFKNIPLVIIIGNEGAGKSSLINYSNIEYPLSDTLQSYKKLHKTTNNFGLYVSKNGALLDTEGNYFSQEEFFKPNRTDEIPEDDLEKNKEFLIKKNVWNKFLSFLNNHIFHSKLNGIALVIDVQSFLLKPKTYSKDIISYLVKRVNECEKHLGLKLPIYIIFSKIDLMEGMSEYWNIFNENVSDRILGLTFDTELNTDELQSSFQEISKSLLYSFMSKNQNLHSIEDKNTAFLFLKQLDYLFALVIEFICQSNTQNKLKNKSHIRGVYFTSAYQENVPRNYLIDAICEKYDMKKPPAKSATKRNKQSYFVQSLLESIILKDSHLSGVIVRNIAIKTGIIIFICCLISYGLSAYFLTKASREIAKSDTYLNNITTLLSKDSYNTLNLQQKAHIMLSLKAILKNYPNLFGDYTFMQYPLLELSYKSFLPAKNLYYKLNEDVISNTLIKEMEQILQTSNNADTLIETFYMYMSLFDETYLNKALLGVWISKNWKHFNRYKILKEDFIAGIEDFNLTNLAKDYMPNSSLLESIKEKVAKIPKQQRIYTLISFNNSLKQERLYNIKDKVGIAFNNVFENPKDFIAINKDYTKDGLRIFLSNLEENTLKAINIDEWCLTQVSDSKDIKALQMDIINIYLAKYQQKWQDILLSITPKKYSSKEGVLNELNILSNVENPLNALIKIVSNNTHLNDVLLLNYAYSLGLPSSDIKAKFTAISNHFKPYYDFIDEESFLDSKINSLSKDNKDSNTNNTKNTREILAMDIQNIHAKISDFTQEDTKDIKAKITYILEGSNEENDPFKKLRIDTKDLPPHIAKYYDKLSELSWNVIENTSRTLLNNAWKNEVYGMFIGEMASFYPFNAYSQESLSMETFKSFFGNKGVLQTFYNQYLNKILLKRGNTYYLNPKYKSKFIINKEFIDFFNRNAIMSLAFDGNNNLSLNFFINCIDLSPDFGSINIGYNDKLLHYDHTLNQKIQVIIEQFNNATEFSFIANDYNQNPKFQKIYKGEWAWFRFLNDISISSTNTLYFEGNKKLYFDFTFSPNQQTLISIRNLLSKFTLPQSVM